MGAGIAQLAARAGARTLLHDPVRRRSQAASQRSKTAWAKKRQKGRISDDEARAAVCRACSRRRELAQLAPCELVIEAAPERLELKHELYRRLSEIVDERCVLASNTSSLL